ncbi:DivIVA domain-containing protein [Fundicoccus sp. Sow4_H7]|uniref:DivIVA domain-containing protein n=1 Tax=Fundicoccus sp. Sow4_H7 TaxID=3438784 RepID=UPI003F90A0B2
MALTPNEILHKEFDTKFRGFDQEQVNDFLDLVVADFERLIKENNQYEQKLDALQEKVDYFNQLQDSLNNSIVVANEAAERLKQNARKEAELILFEAEREADRIMEKASNHSSDIISGTEELRQYAIDYRYKLQSMLNAYQDYVNDEKYNHLFQENPILEKMEASLDYRATNDKVSQRVNELEQSSNEEFAFNEAEDLSSEYDVEDYPTEEVELTELPEEAVSPEPARPSMALSREELSELVNDEDNEIDSLLAQLDSENSHSKAVEELDNEKDLRGESILGQTIRIDLSRDDQ